MSPRIRVANAPCSWGVLEFELEGTPKAASAVLREINAAGYAGTELGDWGFLPTDPQQLRDLLTEHRLDLVAAFVPVALSDPAAHHAGVAQALRVAELLRAVSLTAPTVVLADNNGADSHRVARAGRITDEDSLSSAQWQVFADGAQSIARTVHEETGLAVAFHHHCAGYVETPNELARLFELTDPQLLGLCLDTGHYRFAGGDPLEAIARYADRLRHVHFKDCEPQIARRSRDETWDYFQSVRAGVFCELGRGEVDFPAIVDALRRIDYSGWIVVEQDVLPEMGTPLQSAIRNRQYLQRLHL